MSKALAEFDHDSLHFTPLGGSEQFGVNLNVYFCKGEMLAIDCGVGFADQYFPGIDILLPDPKFIEKNRDALKGLVITHAHEDHIGAVAYLWNRFRCPVYASRFTAAVLHEKFKEEGIKDAEIHIIEPHEVVKLGSQFEVSFIPVAHSIPDTCSLLIETPHGPILHSGDWNLDPKPVIGEVTDEAAFKAAGKKGILAYVGDSTNAQYPGRAGSESEVEAGLIKEFEKCKGKIIVTAFSSNIGRILSIVKAAKAVGRDVGLFGRSLNRMVGCAYDCGFMDDIDPFITEKDLGYLPDERIVMIMTGSQGEARAALARAARGDHPHISLKRNDTVIFSARAIPGNETDINRVINNLVAGGVKVVTPNDTKNKIHVSGHPYRDEIADMWSWLKPRAVIPVHGERQQLEAQALFARECQIPQTVIPQNGSVIKIAPGEVEVVDHVEVGVLALDQKRIVGTDHPSISQRRKLQYTGAAHVSLAMDEQGGLVAPPKVALIGLINAEEQQIEDNLYIEIGEILEDMSRDERQDDHFVEEELRIGVRRFFVHVLGIKPHTTVHLMRI